MKKSLSFLAVGFLAGIFFMSFNFNMATKKEPIKEKALPRPKGKKSKPRPAGSSSHPKKKHPKS